MGGRRLKIDYGIQYDGPSLGEVWLLSCHPSGPSYIENGTYVGYTLDEYIRSESRKMLGNYGVLFPEFPILIKYIDAKEDLSVQVHPPNLYALEHERQLGKMEMWYILDADPDSYIYLGFTRELEMKEFECRIEENTFCQVLYKQYVKKAESVFLPANGGAYHLERDCRYSCTQVGMW